GWELPAAKPLQLGYSLIKDGAGPLRSNFGTWSLSFALKKLWGNPDRANKITLSSGITQWLTSAEMGQK
ncbi:MAG TPA: hypothetical protein VLL97_10005, partial [Acidobacteriota bacterium]|nr:hypothetical protein [Acidobacteriota bacterium]